MGEHELLGIAVFAVPILMQFLKALKLKEAIGEALIPFVAGALGFIVVLGGGWLIDEPINKELIIHAIIGAFGPSGFYELALKRIPVVGTP